MAATASPVDYQASVAQDSQPAAKKRKRGAVSEEEAAAAAVATTAASPNAAGKRSDISDVNGALGGNENGLSETANFADPGTGSNNAFASHNQESDAANAAMAAALQAHGQQMSNYSGGIQQTGFEMGSPTQGGAQSFIDPQFNQHVPQTPNSQGGQVGSPTTGAGGGSKPQVGSEEWHKVRRDNHKEVERRRRETINEGINELAKIVPGNEKNKGSILARTVGYIRDLQNNQATTQDRSTLERGLLEQAVDDLSRNNDGLKQRNAELESERDFYRSSVIRLMEKVKELGGNLQEEENAGIVAKIEQSQH